MLPNVNYVYSGSIGEERRQAEDVDLDVVEGLDTPELMLSVGDLTA